MLVKKGGWSFDDGDSPLDVKLKTLLFTAAAEAGAPDVVQFCQHVFRDFMSGDKDAINANLRPTVFAIALQEGGNEEVKSYSRILIQLTTHVV